MQQGCAQLYQLQGQKGRYRRRLPEQQLRGAMGASSKCLYSKLRGTYVGGLSILSTVFTVGATAGSHLPSPFAR